MKHDSPHVLAAIVEQFAPNEGSNETAIEGMYCLKFSEARRKIPDIYAPSICVIVQGQKQVLLGEDIVRYSPSEFLAVSVDLPLIGEVIEATPSEPYLCLQIMIDAGQMSDLIVQAGHNALTESATGRGLFVGKMNAVMFDAVLRLARLLETPQDIATLAPLIRREIDYRVLNGEYGQSIAQLAVPNSSVYQIARVIQHIRNDIAQPIHVKELADLANMSVSSLHFHFKAVTAMSPLQYHKRLRLTQARQIMLSEGADATSTAYRVGYESTSQFSREYTRMFGAPPKRDVEGIRNAAGTIQ